tara:strand:+ start:709 stop:939 length:231 start_codon:yes stop_codon:yes gene_type:complete
VSLGETLWEGSIAISFFIFMNLFDDYNEELVPDCPKYCDVEHIHKESDEPRNVVQNNAEPEDAEGETVTSAENGRR